MTPDELVSRLGRLLVDAAPATSYGQVVVDVPRGSWTAAAEALRDEPDLACTFFDLLTAVDELDAGLDVVVHLWSPHHRHGVLLRTRCPREQPRLASLAGVFAGAAWHERHAAEMFGLVFDGHPEPTPLLLGEGFEGHPLRKDFVLASRVAKAWPGAKEPGESDADLDADRDADRNHDADLDAGRARPRRRQVPPGVPAGWERP